MLIGKTVYYATNDQSLAIEGTLYRSFPYGGDRSNWSDVSEKSWFLIVPYSPPRSKDVVQKESRRTVPREELWNRLSDPVLNNIGWGNDICSVWPQVSSKAKLKDRLPSEYKRVCDLPGQQCGLDIAGTTHRPSGGWMLLSPATLAIDVVTSPVQVCVFVAVAYAFRNGM